MSRVAPVICSKYMQLIKIGGLLNGMSSRKLTDTEIKDIGFAEGILKDFTHLTNRQSGMDVLEYSNPNSMWSALGNTDTYGAIVGLPTTASFPSGIVVPGVTNYLGVARTMNELGQILSNVPKGYSSGPCKFIEDIMNAIMKGGAILNDMCNYFINLKDPF